MGRITKTSLLLGLAMAGAASVAHAYAPEGDLMKIKGYSPEVIEVTDIQRSRQEWRQPAAPKRTPVEKFFHNIYYGDWMGGVDAFGNGVIRDN